MQPQVPALPQPQAQVQAEVQVQVQGSGSGSASGARRSALGGRWSAPGPSPLGPRGRR